MEFVIEEDGRRMAGGVVGRGVERERRERETETHRDTQERLSDRESGTETETGTGKERERIHMNETDRDTQKKWGESKNSTLNYVDVHPHLHPCQATSGH